MRAVLTFQSWASEARDEIEGCMEGRCPHKAEGVSCELEIRYREDLAGHEAHILDDARFALELARDTERGQEPEWLSRETLELVRIARAEMAEHEAGEALAATRRAADAAGG